MSSAGCGSVGIAVTSHIRGPQFESSHRRVFDEYLFTVNCIGKTNMKKKRPARAHFSEKNDSIGQELCRTKINSAAALFHFFSAIEILDKMITGSVVCCLLCDELIY